MSKAFLMGKNCQIFRYNEFLIEPLSRALEINLKINNLKNAWNYENPGR